MKRNRRSDMSDNLMVSLPSDLEIKMVRVTFEFEGMPGQVCVESLEFTEDGGKTTVTSVTRFDTKEDRDGMVSSGMADGARESYDALATYLTKLS
jgi:uncharacterized protein YndB with AHSA1/START domain